MLVYGKTALSNQFGSHISVWRSGRLDFNGRGDDIGTLQVVDSKVFGGVNPLGGSITATLTMIGGTVDLQSNNMIVAAVNYNYGPQALVTNSGGTGRLDFTTASRAWAINDGQFLYDMVVNVPIQGAAGSQLSKSGNGALALNAENYFTGTNEVHTLIVPATVGSFVVGYNGVVSPAVTVGPTFSTSDIQAALEPLLPVGKGNVRVIGGANEVQSFLYSATGGSFRLSFDSAEGRRFTTGDIPWNATALQVQTALGALPSIGSTANVAVAGNSTSGFSVTFQNALQSTDVPTLLADYSLLLQPSLPTNEVQVLWFGDAMATGGSFTLTFDPDGAGPTPSKTSDPVYWTPDAMSLQGAVQSAMNSIAGLGNTVVGGPNHHGRRLRDHLPGRVSRPGRVRPGPLGQQPARAGPDRRLRANPHPRAIRRVTTRSRLTPGAARRRAAPTP